MIVGSFYAVTQIDARWSNGGQFLRRVLKEKPVVTNKISLS